MFVAQQPCLAGAYASSGMRFLFEDIGASDTRTRRNGSVKCLRGRAGPYFLLNGARDTGAKQARRACVAKSVVKALLLLSANFAFSAILASQNMSPGAFSHRQVYEYSKTRRIAYACLGA